jgi:predicted unusual protein kinase regulating ubiquinone biosynthesis (AarF/ABC1/UbiB family)
MGQHMATLVVLPVEWTSTMKILQDRCEPTPYSALENLFLADMGAPVTELFDDFDPIPIGVASLAQVHVGHHRASGQKVAVKVSLFYESHLRQYLKKQLSSNILTLRNFATLIWTWWRLLSVCVLLLII